MRCGKCCTSFGVCVTPPDMVRISRATGLEPLEFVTAIPEPAGRERTEPAVLISGERSLIVLRWKEKLVCTFYSGEGCGIYRCRPMLCRAYPFVLKQNALADTTSRSCPCCWKLSDERGYRKDLGAYEKEVEAYRKTAVQWNKGPGGSLEDFLMFALPRAP